MAEPSKDTDQSMEDILQSIKRIIADEGEPAPTVGGSDVLELTELLAEDAAIPETIDAFDAMEESPTVGTMSIDEIMAAPISAMPQAPAAPEPVVVPEPVRAPEPAPVIAAAAPAIDHEKLMSEATAAAAASALKSVASHKPAGGYAGGESAIFRSGTTVEDLVMESLKPMLKEWLDGNLPALVRSLVEKEIRRLSA